MNKSIIYSIGIIFCLGFLSLSFAENEQSIPEVTPSASSEVVEEKTTDVSQPDNAALQVLKDKSEQLQEQFTPSEIEKEEEQKQQELETVQIEKQTLESINSEIQNEVESLKKQLEEQEIIKDQLEAEKNKNVEATEKLLELQGSQNELERNIETKNLLLDKNQQEIQVLEQEEVLKEYALKQNLELQRALQEKTDGERQKKQFIFFIVTCAFLFAYGIRFSLAKRYAENIKLQKKYAHHFAAFDILGLMIYLGFLVWFFFYLFPELVVYLLFLVGAIVIVLQEYLFSLISSIFIVQTYHVGERVSFGKREGIIEKFSLLKTFVRNIDDMGTNIQELRVIPNSKFMKEVVSVLPKGELEKTHFKIILPNDLSINEPALVRHIEENVLQKNITVKSYNEITDSEYYYYLDFSFTNTGHPVIEMTWHETREKSNRIKRKVIAEMEKFKKNSKGEIFEEKPLKSEEKTDYSSVE